MTENNIDMMNFNNYFIPTEFLKISKYMGKEILNLRTNEKMLQSVENPEWWKKISNEYKQYKNNKDTKHLTGKFWNNIGKHYGGLNHIPLPTGNFYIYNINTDSERKMIKDIIKGKLLNINEMPKEVLQTDAINIPKSKGNKMNIKNKVTNEVKELWNVGGAADIAFGKILYSNIKSALGKTVLKISVIDKVVAKVSKRMKLKNEVTELVAVLGLLVIAKQFYDHKSLVSVRGYIVNRLYTIAIENTGFDDVLALINAQDTKNTKEK
ncbi:MAG: hypothetical protein KAI79_18545 [Bacteroidales bacterium]|nr:hypothetical protein [Bacteroidales bacterium]